MTKELEIVGTKRTYDDRRLMPLVAEGKVVICANKNHTCIDPEGIGSMLRTKINVNLGVSRDCKDYDVEMQKVMQAVEMGAHAIMDLSSHGNTIPFRRKLTSECPALIGTVPIYEFRDPLSKGSGYADCQRFYRCGPSSRTGWSGFCDTALWHYA